jgi:hypothetical protein
MFVTVVRDKPSAVDVAGTQSAAFQIAELVEYEERMIAGAFVMAVPHAHLCSPCVGLTLESMSRTTPFGGRRPSTRSLARKISDGG